MAVHKLRLVAKTLTKDDWEAQRRLRARWEAEREHRTFTQDDAAAEMGITQGAVSQYLNGHTPLGVVATLRFAKFLHCHPTDIRPDYEHLLATELTSDAFEIAAAWESIPDSDQMKDYLRNLVLAYPRPTKKHG